MATDTQTPAPAESQALEKSAAKTPEVITTPEEYRGALANWQKHYNILTPFTNVSGIAPSFGIIATVVKLNPDKAAGEVYDGVPWLKNGEVAPAKVGLRKLAECGGISTSTERTDPRTIPYYWEFKARASYRGLDGSLTTREATFEWDLRDGSDRLKGWTAQQITEGRKNGLRNCEARAINAAIRECGCGIKQKYTREELAKPFVVVRVAFQPDFTDPDIKRMVTQQAMGGISAMYPQAPALSAGIPVEEIEHDEPRLVGSGRATTSTTDAKAPAAPDANVPPVEGAVRIVKTDVKQGETKGRKWTKFIIVDSNGVEYSTFSESLRDTAKQFQAENAWVEIVAERENGYVNVIEIIKAGSEPKLPLPDPGNL